MIFQFARVIIWCFRFLNVSVFFRSVIFMGPNLQCPPPILWRPSVSFQVHRTMRCHKERWISSTAPLFRWWNTNSRSSCGSNGIVVPLPRSLPSFLPRLYRFGFSNSLRFPPWETAKKVRHETVAEIFFVDITTASIRHYHYTSTFFNWLSAVFLLVLLAPVTKQAQQPPAPISSSEEEDLNAGGWQLSTYLLTP